MATPSSNSASSPHPKQAEPQISERTPSPVEQKRAAKLWVIWIVLAVVAILAAVGVYFYLIWGIDAGARTAEADPSIMHEKVD